MINREEDRRVKGLKDLGWPRELPLGMGEIFFAPSRISAGESIRTGVEEIFPDQVHNFKTG